MDSDSDEEKYYASEDMEDDEPRPPLQRFLISDPPCPDFSTSSSEDEDMLVMWQVNSHNPACGHWPLNPKGV